MAFASKGKVHLKQRITFRFPPLSLHFFVYFAQKKGQSLCIEPTALAN